MQGTRRPEPPRAAQRAALLAAVAAAAALGAHLAAAPGADAAFAYEINPALPMDKWVPAGGCAESRFVVSEREIAALPPDGISVAFEVAGNASQFIELDPPLLALTPDMPRQFTTLRISVPAGTPAGEYGGAITAAKLETATQMIKLKRSFEITVTDNPVPEGGACVPPGERGDPPDPPGALPLPPSGEPGGLAAAPGEYVERYAGDAGYREWFHEMRPGYGTICDAVGLDPGCVAEYEDACGPGYVLRGDVCAEAGPLEGGGCLIATAAYGTELAPQVQRLRELRDLPPLASGHGRDAVSAFSAAYYAFSPAVADLERQSPAFRDAVRLLVAPAVAAAVHAADLAAIAADASADAGRGAGEDGGAALFRFLPAALLLLAAGAHVAAPLPAAAAPNAGPGGRPERASPLRGRR